MGGVIYCVQGTVRDLVARLMLAEQQHPAHVLVSAACRLLPLSPTAHCRRICGI